MKRYIELLDWTAESFKFARNILNLSYSDIIDLVVGPYSMDDIRDSEFVDMPLPIKAELAYIYNELLIAYDKNYRMHSYYVNYAKI